MTRWNVRLAVAVRLDVSLSINRSGPKRLPFTTPLLRQYPNSSQLYEKVRNSLRNLWNRVSSNQHSTFQYFCMAMFVVSEAEGNRFEPCRSTINRLFHGRKSPRSGSGRSNCTASSHSSGSNLHWAVRAYILVAHTTTHTQSGVAAMR